MSDKPFVGQMVQYKYKPESSQPALAAVVTADKGDGWVSLHVFSETSRWVPMVEFAVHCKPAEPCKPILTPFGFMPC